MAIEVRTSVTIRTAIAMLYSVDMDNDCAIFGLANKQSCLSSHLNTYVKQLGGSLFQDMFLSS